MRFKDKREEDVWVAFAAGCHGRADSINGALAADVLLEEFRARRDGVVPTPNVFVMGPWGQRS